MTDDSVGQPRPTRRQLLGGAAVAAAGAIIPGPAVGQQTAAPTVMTQNVYVGVDLFELAEADSLGELLLRISELLGEIDPDRYAARARGIAAGIAAAEPDVVALQEVGLVGRVGDSEPAIDVLETLESALEAEELSYEVAAETVTADTQLPGLGDESGLRVANRDVLLVHDNHETRNTETGIYDAAQSATAGGEEIGIQRGYCLAEVTVGGATFTAVGTHLESSSRSTRRKQAEELLEVAPDDGPVVLAGDFNSGPGTSTDAYDLLTRNFTDAYGTRNPDSDGFTCCQPAALDNEESQLEKRVDAVLVRGATPTAASRTGHEPDDRITYESADGPVELWPSDHAGVVATFELDDSLATPTATPTETPTSVETPTPVVTTPEESPEPTETQTESATEAADGDGPGFGVAGAVTALGGFGYALGRLARRE
ncbi:endonuclease/exonuclease/phosphatase family protein [Halovenus salina]|uniref:Endonuclease/exonuclease/phosphatase family protein n=1 Tax=Halovenus salina TaxID=1510225 RepID=A0ABD5W0R9_9EURY|nr:endonuclease/exonuclease/phosphatase family protein [Halovenus salina]